LAEDLGANAFLLGWVDAHGIVPGDQQFSLIGLFRDERIHVVALLGRSGVICTSHGTERDGQRLADESRALGIRPSTVLGATAVVSGLLSRVAVPDDAIVLAQRVYVLEELAARGHSASGLRQAQPADLDALFAASLTMHEEEVGRPVPSDRQERLRLSIESKVGAGLIWCLYDDFTGRLVFKAGAGAASTQIAQLEGIWVPPDRRRNGIAERCLEQLCRRLLARHRRVSLYVGLDNLGARALYTKLGFRAGTPFTSAILR
jgi:ribosomal protein S18 acetylase RimI-like enzyme